MPKEPRSRSLAVSPPTPPGWRSRLCAITWIAGRRASVWASNWQPTKPSGGGSSLSPDGSPARHVAHPASAPALTLRNPVQSRPGPIAGHATPSLTAAPATGPPSGQLDVPAYSHQLGPQGPLLAYSLSNTPRHGHCGPPSSGLCGYPPHAALIPTYWNRAWPVRLSLPSTLVSTPVPVLTVDSGLVLVTTTKTKCPHRGRLPAESPFTT